MKDYEYKKIIRGPLNDDGTRKRMEIRMIFSPDLSSTSSYMVSIDDHELGYILAFDTVGGAPAIRSIFISLVDCEYDLNTTASYTADKFYVPDHNSMAVLILHEDVIKPLRKIFKNGNVSNQLNKG